jgi:small subunit ribosomal protein S16
MSVKIRLARYGKRNDPFYRVVVACKDKPRDGRFLEVVGTYDPNNKKEKIKVDNERVNYWKSKGATPTETVANLLKTLR